MAFADDYLKKHALFLPSIQVKPTQDLGIIVVIPCLNEWMVIDSLSSLYHCERPPCKVEVIIVINHSVSASEEVKNQNHRTLVQIKNWMVNQNDDFLQFYPIIFEDLPEKHAGAGLARKIGMDEAIFRFNSLEVENGIIACFDADAICSPNYFIELFRLRLQHPKFCACSVHFEHPLSGDFPQEQYVAIAKYEAHLRYLKISMQNSGFPYAYHTVGSAMAVRASTYCKQGGMNKRKAGEDFYFLHKIIPLGNFFELNSTMVIPSARVSDRVPFGTGAAMMKSIVYKEDIRTYHPASFEILSLFFQHCNFFFDYLKTNLMECKTKIPVEIFTYMGEEVLISELLNVRNNSSTLDHFRNRFFKWFDAFKIIRFLNTIHDGIMDKIEVTEACEILLKKLNIELPENSTIFELLETLRKYEKKDSTK